RDARAHRRGLRAVLAAGDAHRGPRGTCPRAAACRDGTARRNHRGRFGMPTCMSVGGNFSRVAQPFPAMLGFGRAEEGPPPVPVVRSRRRHLHPRAGGPPLRRPAVAVLAVPVIASIYFALLLARPARRYLAAT